MSATENRLFFESKSKSILLNRIIYWLSIGYCFLGTGGSIFCVGYILAAILSKTLRISYLYILNDIPILSFFIAAIIILLFFSSTFLLMSWRILKYNFTESCTFERLPSLSIDLYSGEVWICQRNSWTNQTKIIKLPLDTILDIRLEYPSMSNRLKFTIGLITTERIESIDIYYFPSLGSWQIDPEKSKSKLKLKIDSLSNTVELIRDFLYLPPKPSYATKLNCDYLPPELRKSHRLKILEETPVNLTYKLTYILSGCGETWDFNSDSGIITIRYQYFIRKSTKFIRMGTVQQIVIKRELISPSDGACEILAERSKEKYSVILVVNDENDCKRIFTSTSLSDVKDFADRLNYHIARSRQVSKA